MRLLWDNCKKELKEKLGQHHFSSHIKPTSQISYENNELSVLVPSSFTADWIKRNHLGLVKEIIGRHTEGECGIKFVVDSSKPQEPRKPVAVKPAKKATSEKIKWQYSFDSFVVGKCNEFAHASSIMCANNPGKKYNPLFLYGGVGLGKTHLMYAIGRHVQEKNPSAKVQYISSDQFMNQMISSIQKGQMEQFRKKYRELDVLLVDDIQFIAGKERTQEEFFHTFNSLFEEEKQIVVSSDQFPKDIKKLEERLKSRFEWGLIADIQPPEFETKMAIINKKAELNGYAIPNDVAEFLAYTVKSNIRELEGCLARIVMFASFTKRDIDLSLAKETLEGVYSDAKKSIDLQQIQKVVAEYFSLKVNDLKSKNRSRKFVVPRQMAMFLGREYTDESLPQIGKFFGGRDHSTVVHAYQKVKEDVEKNTRLYNDLNAIKRTLGL